MPTVSIALATYNGARHLGEQLRSFAAQTRLPDELVVCDDCSSDATAAIVEDFARAAPFKVRFERNERNLGYNGNFTQAIGRCTGDVIFVSDQDDGWYPTKIERLLHVLEDECVLCVVNDQSIADPDGTATGSTVLGNVRRLGYADYLYGPGCCTAFRRELLAILHPFPGDAVAYDHWLNAIPVLLGARPIVEEPLQFYRRHDGNASNSAFARARAGPFALIAAARRTDVRQAFADKVREIDCIAARLDDRRAVIDGMGLGDGVEPALALLAVERADYAARLASLAVGRLRRIAPIAASWRRGTYGRFSGLRTALKDLAT